MSPHFALSTPFMLLTNKPISKSQTLAELRRDYGRMEITFNNIKKDVQRDPYNTFLNDALFELGDKLQALRLRIDLIELYIKEATL